jgi:RNA polymerase sigma-70 factor (ECF subfamily)
MAAAAPDPDPGERDEDVIARVVAGDVDAFRVLVERHQAAVLRLVRGLSPRSAAAEDIAQDAFVSAFAALSAFDPDRGRFGSWVLAIAKNHCLNARKKRSALSLPDPPEGIARSNPAEDLVRADARRRLDAALDELPDDLRSAFVLAEVVGLTGEAIAELEKVSPGTIRSRLSRAKARLRAALAPLRGEEP